MAIWTLESAKYANFCVPAAVAVGFIPFFQDPSSEKALPWFFWSVATCMGVVIVALRPDGRKKTDFIQPIMFAVLHTGMFLLVVL